MKADKKNIYETIDTILEYGVYLYIFMIFLSKGEGIRNIVIFGNFALWLLTIKGRKNLCILKSPVAVFIWIYLAVIPLSIMFSMDPLFSLLAFKGDPLKMALLFPVIATVMSDEERLKKAIHVIFISLILMVSIGYYSYMFHDLPFLKPDISLMHVWHNRFAGYVNTFFPFAFILFFIWKKPALKGILSISLAYAVVSLILSTSRGGYLAFFAMILVWSLYFSKTRGYNLKKIFVYIIIVFIIIGSLSYHYSPAVKAGITRSESGNLFTLNERTQLWGAAIQAIIDKPVFGWGYGHELFFRDEPFINTPYKQAPFKGPHNEFLQVFFHQGIVGAIPFALMIAGAIVVFWREAFKSTGIKGYVLTACLSVFVGNYFFHGLIESMFKLRHIALVVGLGLAAMGINENSDS